MTKILSCAYRSQRDNVDLPGASCNTTSAVMALEASGYAPSLIVGLPTGKQPEDFLTELGDSQEAYEEMKRRCPQFFDEAGNPTVRPPEAPTMLDWIVERAYGKLLLRYVESIGFDDVIASIDRGRAVVLRGLFTAAGHVVACVGYVCVEDVGGKPGALSALVVDDPWGNYLTGYKDHNGENVEIPVETMIEILRPVGVFPKVGHIIT